MHKGNKMYVELFEAMSLVKNYDENSFKLKNKDKRFIKNFAFNKVHLYNKIVKALAGYGFEKSIDGRLQQMIAECRILFNKELFQKYFKAIAKAKEFAKKYERFGYLLQIIDLEKLIIPKELIYSDKSSELKQETINITEKINNLMEYSSLAGTLLKNYRYYGLTRSRERESELRKISHSGIMASINKALSSRSREAYYRIKEITGNITGDNKAMYDALTGRLDTVTENPYPFKGYIMDYYLDILVSLTECCIKMNKHDEAFSYLEKMNRHYRSNISTDKDQSIISVYLAFRIYLKSGNIKKASSMITHLEKLLVKYKGKIQIDTEFAVMFYVSVTRIEEKKFSKALEAVNRMLTHPMLNKKSDFECYIKILNLVVHYELKNYELLRHLVLSTYRYLCRHQKLFKTEELVIDFIRKMPNVKSDDDLNYYFRIFAVRLEKLKNDKYEKNAFEYFDLLKWVNSKINKV